MVIQAGMVTHTSIKDLLEMPIPRFLTIFLAIGNVLEKRNNRDG